MMDPHPMERRHLSRRSFVLRAAGGALALPSLSAILAACQSRSDEGSAVASEIPLARPDHPVTLPVYDDNPAVADNLAPEGGPLKIYSWLDYIYKKVMKRFEDQAGVETTYTSFSSISEALSKIQNGTIDFDILVGLDAQALRNLVLAKQVQPLNHSYLPNFQGAVWSNFQTPFYDAGSTYTLPYMTWKTGLGYRRDMVATPPSGDPATAFAPLWDQQYQGKVIAFDAYRDMMAMALLKDGVNDVNTSDPSQIQAAGDALQGLTEAVSIKVGGPTYQSLAEGNSELCVEWGGDIFYAQYYLPKGTGTDVLGFYWPPGGVVGNDTIVVSSKAKNPVLAHAFIDFLYDRQNALDNFWYEGFQPPLAGVTKDEWLSQGQIPPTLSNMVIDEADFDPGKNQQIAALTADVDQLYQDAWAQFTSGTKA